MDLDAINALQDDLEQTVAAAADLGALEEIRVAALGRKGQITQGMKSLGAAEPELRKQLGQAWNQVKTAVHRGH